ncbi:hypothetical protein SAMN04487950_1176 [Halogranum rubrum]|uniref:Big-1 domain-containing protein n=1 Tax=Halogranum rubrum TaxID=553466 RepID=A0A1I4CGQ4_9EURY|nr:Ig-like domain-containing protein [Halogranum rubrum]SFK80422.1 hypothetical protein SAMN04487950_1176 [Halogranum rubrum]
MGFRGDDRGVTVQIGAVLLFGMLIISMSMYQATVVPSENEQVEYQHNQQVQADMQSVRAEVASVSESGVTQSVPVRLGTAYPSRALFVNPPTPSGTVRTVPTEQIAIRNARALDDETDDYWTGSETKSFATARLSYEPNYYLYQSAPTTVYENGVLYNEFSETTRVPQSGQSIVDGRRITLVTLGGELSRAQTGTYSIDVRPVSVSKQSVTVTDEDGQLSVVVASRLDPSVWRDTLLADEYDGSDSDSDKYVAAVNPGPEPETVEIVFEDGVEYDLRLARVGVGTDVSEATPTYLTRIDGGGDIVPEGTERRLTAEVRDEFNNPVSGQVVNASVTNGPGSVTPTETSDSDGEVAFRYVAPTDVDDAQSATVTVEFGETPDAARQVTFDLSVSDADLSGGQTNDGSAPSPSVRLDDHTGLNGNDLRYILSYDVENVNESFERVEARFESTTTSAKGTRTSDESREGFIYTNSYGAGTPHDIELRVIYRNGDGEEYVAATRSISDTADTENWGRNDDLSVGSSPQIDSLDIKDDSNQQNNKVRYKFGYEISGQNFDHVEIAVLSKTGDGPAIVTTSPDFSRNNLPVNGGFGAGNEYKVALLVYDTDGVVVDSRIITDTADGTDP